MTVRDLDDARPRRGRPPAQEAGQAEERILETATTLFLADGFGRTTLDAVSRKSGTGKSAVYRRYPDKEALFAAVVHRSIQAMFTPPKVAPASDRMQDRLRSAGIALVENLLEPRCIALMRITAAEAENFPGLAEMAYRTSFDGSVRYVTAALAHDAPSEKLRRAAERFVEIAVQPLSFQAIFGHSPAVLRDRAEADIEDAILLLGAKGLLADPDRPG
ncbi:TetR/AcrR family transcriptional regulator [Profundibacterium mesophilum]|uniref:Transcriptional regulatory protein n=1 Tax=Profundibacterium mesophilum KAUST100406-0324 TaxID=1037889 RepID=A0A921NPS0_9RHOB|nr:TetR/AcrR family transcriptional regulator [Profundibacterium mesophilum]KAF0674915.1 Transcriptional regulatory protein [Profundibacterium mesophilum KAUST100406-0324]